MEKEVLLSDVSDRDLLEALYVMVADIHEAMAFDLDEDEIDPEEVEFDEDEVREEELATSL